MAVNYKHPRRITQPAEGTTGQVLTTDGAGAHTWQDGGGGTDDIVIESANPKLEAKDSSATDSDVNGDISFQLTDTGSGSEDCDFSLKLQIAGTLTEVLAIDADGKTTFTNDLVVPAGSASSPGIKVSPTGTYGIFNGTNTLSFSAGATSRLDITTGAVACNVAVKLNHSSQSATLAGLYGKTGGTAGGVSIESSVLGHLIGGSAEILQWTDTVIDFKKPVIFPTFTDATRGSVPAAGTQIYNSDDAEMNHSDGTNWILASTGTST